METKECKDCGKELDVSMFHYSDKPKGILKSYCKDCSYKRVKKYIDKDPIAHKHYMQRHCRENPHLYPGNHISKKVPKVCAVYKIDCLLTNDFYIGVSTNVRDRMYKHRKASGKGKQRNLYKLIKEYGWEAFQTTILEECTKENMFEKETAWIEYLSPNLNNNKTK